MEMGDSKKSIDHEECRPQTKAMEVSINRVEGDTRTTGLGEVNQLMFSAEEVLMTRGKRGSIGAEHFSELRALAECSARAVRAPRSTWQ